MKRLLYLIPILLVAASCGKIDRDGDTAITRTYEYSTFSRIKVGQGLVLTMTDKVSKVTATGAKEVLDSLKFDLVGDGKLEIWLGEYKEKEGNVAGRQLEILLPSNTLTSIVLEQGASLKSDIQYRWGDLSLECSGGSAFMVPAICNSVKVDITGESKIAEANGGKTLTCDLMKGDITGGSEVFCHSDGKIICDITGGSTLTYTGNADTSESSTSGGSRIIHRQ